MSTGLLVLTIILMVSGAVSFAITSVTKDTFTDVIGICLLTVGGLSGATYSAIVSL